MHRAGYLLATWASRSLPWRPTRVKTPLGVEAGELDLAVQPLLVGVLGASLHMLEGAEQAYPDARGREEEGGARKGPRRYLL